MEKDSIIKGNKKDYSNITTRKRKFTGRRYFQAKHGSPQNSCMIICIQIAVDDQPRLVQMQKQANFDLKNEGILRCVQKPFSRQLTIDGEKNSYLLIPLPYCKTPLLKRYGQLKKEEQMDIMMALATTVAFLHQKQIVHGKLNCENIYVRDTGIKIVPPEPSFCRKGPYLTARNQYDPPYGTQQNKSADIWSLGIIFYEIVLGVPLSSIKQLQQKPRYPLNQHRYKMGTLMIRLLGAMLQKDPVFRCDINVVIKFLEQIKNDRFNYRLLLLEQERDEWNRLRDNELKQTKNEGQNIQFFSMDVTESRVILKKHLLSLTFDHQNKLMKIQILFRSDLFVFMTIQYSYDQLPQEIKDKWESLQSFFNALSVKNKNSIRILSNGVLEFSDVEFGQISSDISI